MNGKDEEVSHISGEKSPIAPENSPMSAKADVDEMQALCTELANNMARSNALKDRITAVDGVLGGGWNRALEFLRGKALRVDSWEKDLARQKVERLREAERAKALQGHVHWLRRSVEHLRSTDEEFYSLDLDVLERLVGVAGTEGGSVVAVAAEGPAEPVDRTPLDVRRRHDLTASDDGCSE